MAAVLLYRLISFWIPLPVGAGCYLVLARKRRRQERAPQNQAVTSRGIPLLPTIPDGATSVTKTVTKAPEPLERAGRPRHDVPIEALRPDNIPGRGGDRPGLGR